MTPPTAPLPKTDSRLGITLRVLFFIGTAYAGANVLEPLAAFTVHSIFLGSVLGGLTTGLLANALTMRIFDRRPLADIGLAGGAGSGRNFLIGLGLAASAAGLLLLAPLLGGSGHLVLHPEIPFSWLSVAFYLIMLVFGAAGEELIFHGYAFQFLVEKMGPFATALPVGILFGFAHAANPYATRIAVLNTALWGILLGYAFLRSRDLWLPIGMHYGWNAVLPLFGANLSGITIKVTRYTYQWDLAPMWSGGEYGPEGGLLATIFICVLFFALGVAPIAPQIAGVAKSLNEPVWD